MGSSQLPSTILVLQMVKNKWTTPSCGIPIIIRMNGRMLTQTSTRPIINQVVAMSDIPCWQLLSPISSASLARPTMSSLDKQTISFVSVPGITIGVSDDELSPVAESGYSFMPNYMSKKVEGYLMNVEGSRFDVTPEGGLATVPFRPYFVQAPAGTRGDSRKAVKHIIFDGDDSSFVINEDDPSKEEIATENMIFTTRRHEIIVTSYLRVEADVRIYNISGITVANFTILPGETISTYIPISGVYIVRAADGRYQKKLAVK